MKRLAFVSLLVLAPSLCLGQRSDVSKGPFGFERGMTRAQISAVLGEEAIKKSDGDVIYVTAAPKPNTAFEEWLLMISPKLGLVKIMAVGKDVESGDSGTELKAAFDRVVDAMSKKYGRPTNIYDMCRGSDVECDHSESWMLSMKRKNRSLAAYWTSTTFPNRIHAISVKANVLKTTEGYITCAYEFDTFPQYVDERNAKQGFRILSSELVCYGDGCHH